MAPMSDPRFVLAVMVDDPDPKAGGYYGGTIAGPVFSKTMRDTMRLYNVTPDKLDTENTNSKDIVLDQEKRSGGQI